MTDALLTVLAACWGHTRVVTYLNISACQGVTDIGSCILVPRLPQLELLDATDLPFVTDNLVSAVTTEVPKDDSHHVQLVNKLRNIGAARKEEADGCLRGLAPSHELLETVARVFGHRTDTAASRAPTALPCPKLLSLNLGNCPGITDVSLLRLASHYTRITALDVSGSSITDRGLRELLVYCRSLSTLSIARTAVTDAAFDQLPIMGRLVPVNPNHQRKDVLASRAPPSALAKLPKVRT